jgi:hypothetical protein
MMTRKDDNFKIIEHMKYLVSTIKDEQEVLKANGKSLHLHSRVPLIQALGSSVSNGEQWMCVDSHSFLQTDCRSRENTRKYKCIESKQRK